MNAEKQMKVVLNMKFETQSRPERREGPHHSEIMRNQSFGFFLAHKLSEDTYIGFLNN